MITKLAVLCEECLTLSLDSSCECGKVASRNLENKLGIIVYCDSHESLVLTKIWLDQNGVISFFRRYKDLKTGKILPFKYIKEK